MKKVLSDQYFVTEGAYERWNFFCYEIFNLLLVSLFTDLENMLTIMFTNGDKSVDYLINSFASCVWSIQ